MKIEEPLAPPMIVYTDLDGTLLDHQSYDYTPVLAALTRLKQQGTPLIPVTSKTFAEVLPLWQALGLRGPLVLEDGCLIAIPQGSFSGVASDKVIKGYQFLQEDSTYEEIVSLLRVLRARHAYAFTGFSDMSVQELAQLTGLSPQQAQLAKTRHCSEPLLWQGSETQYRDFLQLLAELGYCMSKGGRFWLVKKGKANKGLAVEKLNKLYQQAGLQQFVTIGLGDSPNDLPMLAQVDIAALIRRYDGSCLSLDANVLRDRSHACWICSCDTGPKDWHDVVQYCLDSVNHSLNQIR